MEHNINNTFHQLPPTQQGYIFKTIKLMQLTGRTDHHFTLIQGDIAVYEGNDSQTALDALSSLRRTAIEQLKAGKADIHAYLLCQYPDGHTEIVGEV